MADSKLANLLRNDNAWKGDADLAAFNQFEAQAEPWYRKGLPMEGRGTFLPFRDTLPDSVMNQREWALPSIIAAPINAITAPFRAATGSDPTFNAPEEAMNLAGSVFGGGVGTSKAMTAPMGVGGKDLAMNAYHGTPHEIKGGFDLSKVGTGEGAQVFGHGIYFAENPKIATHYRTELSKTPDTLGSIQNSAQNDIVNSWIKQSGGDRQEAAKAYKQFVTETGLIERDPDIVNATLKAIETPKGNFYKVDIPDAAIPMMIDWDKPISNQSPKVLEFLKQHPAIIEDINSGKSLDTLNGRNAYQAIASSFDVGPKEAYKLASEYLANQGITGIRYLDEGSRKAGKGTSNFVVFDPTTVKILEKNDKPVDRKDLIKEQIDKLTE